MSEQDEMPDATGAFSTLALGFQLSKRQQALVIRILWVLLVSVHIAWACGWLSVIGLAGFAKAEEVRDIRQTIEASARVTLGREIREQALIRCRATDPAVRDSLTRYIDALQGEYERIAKQRYPEPPCSP